MHRQGSRHWCTSWSTSTWNFWHPKIYSSLLPTERFTVPPSILTNLLGLSAALVPCRAYSSHLLSSHPPFLNRRLVYAVDLKQVSWRKLVWWLLICCKLSNSHNYESEHLGHEKDGCGMRNSLQQMNSFKVSNIHSTLWSCWVLVGIEAITFQVYLLRMKQSFILKFSCSNILISCHPLLPVAVVKIWCLSSLPWIHWTSSAQLDLWCASSRCSGTYFPVPASPGWKALKSHRSPLLDLGKSWELSTWISKLICTSSGCLTKRSLAKNLEVLKVHQRTCWQPLWAG